MWCDSCRKKIPVRKEYYGSNNRFLSILGRSTNEDGRVLCEKCALLPVWKKALTSWWFWIIIVIVFFLALWLLKARKKESEKNSDDEPSERIKIVRQKKFRCENYLNCKTEFTTEEERIWSDGETIFCPVCRSTAKEVL